MRRNAVVTTGAERAVAGWREEKPARAATTRNFWFCFRADLGVVCVKYRCVPEAPYAGTLALPRCLRIFPSRY